VTPRVLAAVALATATAIAVAGIALAPRGEGETGAGRPGFAGALRPPGIPPADFALRDQDGEQVTLADVRGEVAVVTFLYSTCEDTCPLVAQQIRGALDQLGRDVPVMAFSVDPAGDTPRSARAFLAEQRLTGDWHFLLGDPAALQPVWDAYGIQPQAVREGGPDADHGVSVVLLDRQGRQRIGFPPDGLTPEGLAADIARLQRGEPPPG